MSEGEHRRLDFKTRLKTLLRVTCMGIAEIFQCDQKFQQFQIVPYQAHVIRVQGILASPGSQNNKALRQQCMDSMLVQNDQTSKWGQLKSAKWWKVLFCCQNESDPFQSDDQSDEQEPTVVDFSLLNKLDTIPENNENEEKEVAITDKELNMTPVVAGSVQISDQMINSSIADLSAVELKVKGRPRMGSNYKKDSYNTQVHTSTNQRSNQTGGQTGASGGSQGQTGQFPSALSLVQQKGSQQPTLTEAIIFGSPLQNNADEPKVQGDKHQDPQTISPMKKDDRGKVITAEEDFGNLQNNIQTQDPLKEGKSIYEDLISCLSAKTNKLDTGAEKAQPGHQPHQDSLEKAPEPIAQPAQPDKFKSKKRTRNLDLELVADTEHVQVLDEQPPEDLGKKRRRRRQKSVFAEEKERQQRTRRREEEDLEVIIYSDNEDDN